MSNEEEPGFDELEIDDDEVPIQKNDFGDVLGDLWGKLPVFGAFILFFIFILINTDFFISNCLGSFTDQGQLTLAGTMIQGVVLVLLYIVFDIAHKAGVI